MTVPLYSPVRAGADIFIVSPVIVTFPSFIFFAPWSGLSRVAIRLSLPVSDKLKMILNSIAPEFILPSHDPGNIFLYLEICADIGLVINKARNIRGNSKSFFIKIRNEAED